MKIKAKTKIARDSPLTEKTENVGNYYDSGGGSGGGSSGDGVSGGDSGGNSGGGSGGGSDSSKRLVRVIAVVGVIAVVAAPNLIPISRRRGTPIHVEVNRP